MTMNVDLKPARLGQEHVKVSGQSQVDRQLSHLLNFRSLNTRSSLNIEQCLHALSQPETGWLEGVIEADSLHVQSRRGKVASLS